MKSIIIIYLVVLVFSAPSAAPNDSCGFCNLIGDNWCATSIGSGVSKCYTGT